VHVNVSALRMPGSSQASTLLLGAVLDVSSDLDLSEVLTRIVRSACAIVGAHYGALGVLRPDRQGLMEFVTDGLTPGEVAQVGPPPIGMGVLGLLITEPTTLRLADVSAHPASTGVPPGHPRMTSFLGTPIRVRGEVFGNLYLTDKVGGLEFTDEDEVLVVALAAAAGMAIDNALMFEAARRQQQWSAALGEMGQALLSGLDQREALGVLAERALLAAEAQLAAIALVQEDELIVEAATGTDAHARSIVGTPLTEPHWHAVLESGEPLLLLTREGEGAADASTAQLRAAGGLPEHGATALVPMTVGAGSIGLLVVAWIDHASHVPHDVTGPLKQYADQVAVTLTAATAQADRSRMDVLEERERIARDMHDVVIQRLFATGLGLQSAARVASHPYVQSRLVEAVDELDLAIKDIRRMIFALHQPLVDSLTEELTELVEGFEQPLGFPPSLHVLGSPDDVDNEVIRLDLLAVVREALSNVARHAGAKSVDVEVAVADGSVQVTIEDDGRGMSDTSRRSGLANLTERAVRHAGALVVQSPIRQRGGTRLVWRIPRGAPDSVT